MKQVPDKISPITIEVMQLLADGYSSKEAGEFLGLTTDAILMRSAYVRKKLGAKNVTHAVAILLKTGKIK